MSSRILIAALLSLAATAPAIAEPEAFDLDSTHTYPSFEVNHLGFSVMRGIFTSTKGTLTLDNAAKKGSVEATIDVASVQTGYGKRDDHLRSKDFFNAEQFPTMTFKADSFAWDGKPTQVAGNLTLLGVTKPVTLAVQPTKCDTRMDKAYVCGAIVTTTINRSDFGMKAYVPYVGDEIKVQIEVEAAKHKAG
ncbi:MAG TPA: YceI family protein [Burkholderiaceae bacterium]|nr:YceI family protein [Burkholderiaceae bacterium]